MPERPGVRRSVSAADEVDVIPEDAPKPEAVIEEGNGPAKTKGCFACVVPSGGRHMSDEAVPGH